MPRHFESSDILVTLPAIGIQGDGSMKRMDHSYFVRGGLSCCRLTEKTADSRVLTLSRQHVTGIRLALCGHGLAETAGVS